MLVAAIVPMHQNKQKILFVCTINRMRSATAHTIYKDDSRFEVKSAGTDKSATTVLTNELFTWADAIVVMEKEHRNYIRKNYKDIYNSKRIVCLYVPDNYGYMQQELINLLKARFEEFYNRGLL
jgi:predicted protein tyrosine phosphatase